MDKDKKHIEELKRILKKETGEEISDEKAEKELAKMRVLANIVLDLAEEKFRKERSK